jgi:hypothetical protein
MPKSKTLYGRLVPGASAPGAERPIPVGIRAKLDALLKRAFMSETKFKASLMKRRPELFKETK